MKIGITTIFNVPNFGSVLQAFATQTILEKMGHRVEIINYEFPNSWHFRHGLKKISFKSIIFQWLGLRPHHRKAKKLESFRRKHLNFTKKYNSLEALQAESWIDYDFFCVGSDQVWNPRFVLGDSAFMLSYIPDNKRRISIASSFAVKSIPQIMETKYRKYLSKFDALSVRDNNGVDIINDQLKIHKDIKVILDPTLLISKDQWIELEDKSFCKKKKYILLYLLCYAFEPRPYVFEVIKYFKEQYGYDQIIALEGYDDCRGSGIQMVDATDSSINRFISLFKNADLVITSSFHGTAFAINFGRPLISITPEGNEDDRQSTILKSLHLERCITYCNKKNDDLSPFYDVKKEQERLAELRQDSLTWVEQKLFEK